MFLLGGYFLINMLQSQVSSTGAFEIYFDERLIFSKLATGRMPSPLELSRLIH
jgi:selT/selW/selH-like putative selenoprotein